MRHSICYLLCDKYVAFHRACFLHFRSDTYSGILSGILSGIFCPEYFLAFCLGFCLALPVEEKNDILFGILSDNLSYFLFRSIWHNMLGPGAPQRAGKLAVGFISGARQKATDLTNMHPLILTRTMFGIILANPTSISTNFSEPHVTYWDLTDRYWHTSYMFSRCCKRAYNLRSKVGGQRRANFRADAKAAPQQEQNRERGQERRKGTGENIAVSCHETSKLRVACRKYKLPF